MSKASQEKKKGKLLTITMQFTVPRAELASGFTQLLIKRMHKYLSKHAVTVYKMDTVIE